MNKKTLAPIGVTIVVLMMTFLAGCANTTPDTKVPDDQVSKTDTILADATVHEIEMESFSTMDDGKYLPQFSLKEITVKKGETVRMKINDTKGSHDFKIDEFNVFAETPEGQVTIIDFVPDKVGQFVYYCSKPNHRALGQWGTLTVTE